MEADEASFPDDVERPAFEHSLRTAQGFLGGLEQEDVAARELRSAGAEQRGRRPSSEATWTSCPQACMVPSMSEWNAMAAFSWMGSASISARSTTLRPGRPPSIREDPTGLGDPAQLPDVQHGHAVADQCGRGVLARTPAQVGGAQHAGCPPSRHRQRRLPLRSRHRSPVVTLPGRARRRRSCTGCCYRCG